MLEGGVVAAIRAGRAVKPLRIAQALLEGGVISIEVTMNTPNALQAIEDVADSLETAVVGAGTVLDSETARQAILVGAQFLVTPTVELDVIEMAHRYGVIVMPGAMTPTEILTAWEAGAQLVKVFPAEMLGPAYFKAVRGPLPQVPLVPTGGITADNAGAFIQAGAAMVCAGGWLVSKQAVDEGRYDMITARAAQLIDAVYKARKGI